MGRTLPTSTQLIQEFEQEWSKYERALRREDREALRELFAMVRLQSAPIAYAASPDPFQAFTLAMLGGVLRRVMHLERMLEDDTGTRGHGDGENRHGDTETRGRGEEEQLTLALLPAPAHDLIVWEK